MTEPTQTQSVPDPEEEMTEDAVLKAPPEPSLSDSLKVVARSLIWQGRIRDAFVNMGSLFSLVLNVILIVALVITLQQLFSLKAVVEQQLIGGLYSNFEKMDEAKIKTSVTVNTTIPVQFTLPVESKTFVTLTEDTLINDAYVSLNTGGLSIYNAPADIILPSGTTLPIALSITVPVDTTVPVVLNVPVDIPLSQTELHEPFVGLQDVLRPYRILLNGLPDSWEELNKRK
ncbi:MAG TPA: hypothetical protein PKW33_06380 [Anaerolineaceae bacterium]|nr:hypothetical protein [Anaerolineaceae bacterium]HPN51194.1 hypothetical protein [Anaerolineaceae bacterium]